MENDRFNAALVDAAAKIATQDEQYLSDAQKECAAKARDFLEAWWIDCGADEAHESEEATE